jgi:Uma2 family endonuclease
MNSKILELQEAQAPGECDPVLTPTPHLHRFTVAEYVRMGEVGIFGEDDRVELIDGVIVEMAPIGPEHASQVTKLQHRLTLLLGDRALVPGQNPIVLDDGSMPEPDVVIARFRADYYQERHPRPEDIILIIEVADSSVVFDRRSKSLLYARAQVPEYWMFNLPDRAIEVFRSPTEAGYREVTTLRPGDRLSILLLPEGDLDVADLLIAASTATQRGGSE